MSLSYVQLASATRYPGSQPSCHLGPLTVTPVGGLACWHGVYLPLPQPHASSLPLPTRLWPLFLSLNPAIQPGRTHSVAHGAPALTMCRDEDFHRGTERPHSSFGDCRDPYCAGGIVDWNGNLSAAAVLANVFRQLFLGTEKKGEDMKHQGATAAPEGSQPSRIPGGRCAPAATLPQTTVGSCSMQL